MKIAVTFGPMCFLRSPAETLADPRTGSELGFVRICEELRKLGHDVTAICGEEATERYDVAVAINEPDRLRTVAAKLRICMFWLNGTEFCQPGFADHVDAFVSPSREHKLTAVREWDAPRPSDWYVNYLGCDPELYGGVDKIPGRVVYCSSPDRGLHRVLEAWPVIKRAVPHATLHIFYRLHEWIAQLKATEHFPPIERLRTRALYCEQALELMSNRERWGITVRDSVNRATLIREMSQAEVLAYPVETTSWSEGFSCATMEGCAAGCAPIITDCDAMGEVYQSLEPIPVGQWGAWRDRVVQVLKDDVLRGELQAKAKLLASENTWSKHAQRLDALLVDLLRKKDSGQR